MELDYHLELAVPIKVKGEIGGVTAPLLIPKTWGWERVHINTHHYCMKELWINAGLGSSIHTHIRKHETLMVVSGLLEIELWNKGLAEQKYILGPGHSFVMVPGMIHRLKSISEDEPGTLIIEASTYSEDSDSIRFKE